MIFPSLSSYFIPVNKHNTVTLLHRHTTVTCHTSLTANFGFACYFTLVLHRKSDTTKRSLLYYYSRLLVLRILWSLFAYLDITDTTCGLIQIPVSWYLLLNTIIQARSIPIISHCKYVNNISKSLDIDPWVRTKPFDRKKLSYSAYYLSYLAHYPILPLKG